jgi:hypothetical protein
LLDNEKERKRKEERKKIKKHVLYREHARVSFLEDSIPTAGAPHLSGSVEKVKATAHTVFSCSGVKPPAAYNTKT